MKTMALILFAILVTITGAQASSSDGYRGCFAVTRRQLGVNPGTYNPNNLSPDDCKRQCGFFGYQYAALYAGKFCFCTNTIRGSAASDAQCTDPCTDNSGDKCGSSDHVSLYESVRYIRGLTVSIDKHVIAVGDAVSVQATQSQGDHVEYAVDFGDENGRTEKDTTNSWSKKYGRPGTYKIAVYAADSNGTYTEKRDSISVQALERVSGLSLECPAVGASNLEISCTASVRQGSRVTASINWGDGEAVDKFPIADPLRGSAGPTPPEHHNVNDTSQPGLYVMAGSEFTTSGQITAWEMHAAASGNIKILVLSPTCPNAAHTYCFMENMCNSTCDNGPMQYSCQAEEQFSSVQSPPCCMQNGACQDGFGNRTSQPLLDWTVKAVMDYTIPNVGYNYHSVDTSVNNVFVTYGDVLGYINSGSGRLSTRDLRFGEMRSDFKHNSAPSLNEGDTWASSDSTATDDRHLLRVSTSRDARMLFHHTFIKNGKFNVTAEVTNDLGHVEAKTVDLIIQLGIDLVIINNTEYATPGLPTTMCVEPHEGDNVTYVWQFGDGKNATTMQLCVSHVYTDAREYTLRVHAFNKLSEKSNSSTIIAMTPLKDLKFEADPKNVMEKFDINVTLGAGTNYSCSLYCDSATYYVLSDSQIPGVVSLCRYSLAGVKSVLVRCENPLGTLDFRGSLTVAEPVGGLKLLKEGANLVDGEDFAIEFSIDTGTDVEYELKYGPSEIILQVTFDPTTKTGKSLPISIPPKPGVHPVIITVWNSLSREELVANFTIEKAVSGLEVALSAEQPIKIRAGGNITTDVTVNDGTSVTLIIDWGDRENYTYSTPTLAVWSEVVDGGKITKDHTYNSGGVFTLTVTAKNAFNEIVKSYTVDVVVFIENLVLTSDSPVGLGNAVFNVTQTSGIPPDGGTEIQFDFGDGSPKETFKFKLHQTYTHKYTVSKTYMVTAVVWNMVNSMTISTNVSVIVPVTDLKMAVYPPHAAIGQTVSMDVTVYAGNGITYEVDFGDASAVQSKPRQGSTPSDKTPFSHTYNSAGNYTITVVAQNILGKTTKTYVIAAQHALDETRLTYTSTAPRRFPTGHVTIDLQYDPGVAPVPNDVEVAVDWDSLGNAKNETPVVWDIALSNTLQLTTVYLNGGLYTSRVYVYNLASVVVLEIDTSAYADITSLSVTPKFKPETPLKSPAIVGLGDGSIYFPSHLPVLFYMTADGTVEKFEMVAVKSDGSKIQMCCNNSNPLESTFPKTGSYDVTITASNPFTSAEDSVNLVIFEAVRGVQIIDLDGGKTIDVFESKTFNVTHVSLGTDSCIEIELEDGSETYTEYYGDTNQCNRSQNLPLNAVYKGPATNPVFFTKQFNRSAEYTLTVRGHNEFSEESKVVTFTVSGASCSKPSLSIGENAYALFSTPKVVRRKNKFTVVGDTKLNCETTTENQKSWKVQNVDKLSGDFISDVDLTNISTRSTAEISFPGKMLDYGLYKFTYTVLMDPSKFKNGERFSSEVVSYVSVEESSLVVSMIPGGITKKTVPYNITFKLDPEAYSYDPDDDNDQKTDFTYEYYCYRAGEVLPVDPSITDNYPYNLAKTGGGKAYTVAELAAGNITDYGGCFMKGVGMMNYSQGKVEFSTLNMHENTTYEILVIIRKGTRRAYGTLTLNVIPGDPPDVTIFCQYGSVCETVADGVKVNHGAELALQSLCSYGCSNRDQLLYEWDMQVRTQEGSYDYWHSIDNLDQYIWGLDSAVVTLNPEVYNRWQHIKQVSIRLTVTRVDQSGYGELNIYVNSPPEGGSCVVTPMVGTVFDGRTIQCQGWSDEDDIKQYTFLAVRGGASSQIGFSQSGKLKVDGLPIGDENNDYNMTVRVQIVDQLGSTAVVNIPDVQVTNPPKADMTQAMENFQIVAAEGNVQTITTVTSAVFSLLNKEEIPTTSNMTENEQKEVEKERDNLAKTREDYVNVLSSQECQDISCVTQITSAMEQVLLEPSQVTRNSQEKTTQYLENLADNFDSLSTDLSREETKVAAEGLINLIYNVMTASDDALEVPLQMDIERAKGENWQACNYDTSLNNPNPGTALEFEFNKRASSCNTEVQTESSTKTVTKMLNSLNVVSRGLLSKVAPGSPPMNVVTKDIALQVQKDNPSKVLNATVNLGSSGAEAKMPVFDFNNDTSSCISSQVVVSRENAMGALPGSELVGKSSSIQIVLRECSDELEKTTTDSNAETTAQPNTERDIDVTSTSSPVCTKTPRSSPPPAAERVTDHKISTRHGLYLRSFNVTTENVAVHVELEIDEPDVSFLCFVNYNNPPNMTTQEWDTMKVITGNDTAMFVSNKLVHNRTGKYWLGCRQLLDNETDLYTDEAANFTRPSGLGSILSNFSIRTFASQCSFFRKGSDKLETYGCEVGPESNNAFQYCCCDHLTSFLGGWVVMPNTIDFDYVFSDGAAAFENNLSLYITEIVIGVLYILAAVWARRTDKKDVQKIGVTPMPDNDPNDKYMYEIIVHTGMRKNAGTDSKVNFILSGEYDETDVRVLGDDKRPILRRGGEDAFLMTTPRPLGGLNYARIWHDNSGKGKFASWYLKYFLVRDVQTDEKFYFICNRWFAVEEDDGQVDRLIPVAGREQMVEFSHLFTKTSQKNLGDGHLWFSVVARPPKSRFTRLQRVSCCLSLLFMSMLTNAMFYETTPEEPGSNALVIGPFSVSPEQIYIGVISNIIVFPVNLLIVTLFRKSRPKKKRKSRITTAIENNLKKSTPSIQEGMGLSAVTLAAKSEKDMKGELVEVRVKSPKRPDTSLSTRINELENTVHNRPQTTQSSVPSMYNYKPVIKQEKKKKKKCELPWWGVIIGWVILWISVLGSATLVTFYGITFREEKARKWITSMIISTFMSVFVTQPIKVFLLAIFIALIIKKVDDDDEEEGEEDEERPAIELAADEEWLHPSGPSFGAAKPRKIAYKPPDPAALELARENRIKELKMYDILREIIFYSMFLWILMVISYGQRDPNSFFLKENMENNVMLRGDKLYDFNNIKNNSMLFSWFRQGMMPGLRADRWYNNAPPVGQRGFIGDRVGRIMGFATMRQLRAKKGSCKVEDVMKQVIHECNEDYDMLNEETGLYGAGWQPYVGNATHNNSRFEYQYTSASDLDGYPHYGRLALYGGGGYVVRLQGSLSYLEHIIKRLEDEMWLDKYTRALFIEFSVYNPGVNLFVVGTVLVEYPACGGMVLSYRFDPVKLFSYVGNAMAFQIACEITFFLFIFVFLYKEFRKFWVERTQYFNSFWTWIELGIIGSSIGGAIVYFYRLVITNSLTETFKASHGNEYIKFQYVSYWNELLNYMIAFLCFLATIKFLKLLRFNKRMSFLASTIRYSAKNLLYFAVMFGIIFCAFVQFFHLDLGAQLRWYSTFIDAFESCIMTMLGKFEFEEMRRASAMTPFFFFLFVATVTWTLLNMLLSIINESFTAVKNDASKQSNEYEMVDFMIRRFKAWTGMGTANAVVQSAQTPEKLNNQHGNEDSPQVFENQLLTFPQKVDKLLNSIGRVYFDIEKFDSYNSKEAFKIMLKSNKMKDMERYSDKSAPGSAMSYGRVRKNLNLNTVHHRRKKSAEDLMMI